MFMQTLTRNIPPFKILIHNFQHSNITQKFENNLLLTSHKAVTHFKTPRIFYKKRLLSSLFFLSCIALGEQFRNPKGCSHFLSPRLSSFQAFGF
jgi:hypothetical protein